MTYTQPKQQGHATDRALYVLDKTELDVRQMADEDLMLAYGEGLEEAFDELLRRHQRGVLNFSYRMVQNRALAEDLTQDVFMALVKSAQRYQPMAKFTTYLYRIAANLVTKEWSRRKRRPSLFSLSSWGKSHDEDAGSPLDVVGDDKACVLTDFQRGEVSEAINEALKCLPDKQREAFVLHRLQDLPYEEVSSITNSPVGTIKSRVWRAEQALRPLLENYREYT